MENIIPITLLLLNGNTKGIIQCTFNELNITSYKIPRNKIEECKNINELKHNGIYFLFDEINNQKTIYIGQGKNKNGGLLFRIQGKHKNQNFSDIDNWTEAIAFTKIDNSLDDTEINYLENKFYNLAKQANRYIVKNNTEPPTFIKKDKKILLDNFFVKYVKLFTEILGHKVFEPITEDEIPQETKPQGTQEEPITEPPVDDSIKKITLKDISFSKKLKLAYFEIFGKRYTVKRARDIYPELVKIFIEKYPNLCTYKDNKFVLEKSNFKLELYKKEDLPPYASSKHICDDYHLNTHGDITKVESNIKKIVSLMGISEDNVIIGYYQKSVSGKDWKEEPNFSLENIKSKIVNNNDDLLYMTYKEANAKCIRTNDGFLVLKGSKINPTVTNSCGKEIIQAREEHKDKIDSSYILKENILFDSSSRSAGFVAGHSVSGPIFWKDKNGKSLKELEQQ